MKYSLFLISILFFLYRWNISFPFLQFLKELA